MKIQIDCYGFEAASEHFQRRKLEVFLIKNENAPAPKASGCLSEANPKDRKWPRGIVYACFGTGEMRPIHRIDKDPDVCVRVMWVYGRWDESEDLAYVPINETIMIERKD